MNDKIDDELEKIHNEHMRDEKNGVNKEDLDWEMFRLQYPMPSITLNVKKGSIDDNFMNNLYKIKNNDELILKEECEDSNKYTLFKGFVKRNGKEFEIKFED